MTIALWCIFIAATLPYVPFSYVKGLDPIQPRHHVRDLAERSLRAYGAHLNGLETFPWFAAAVIVSHIVGGPTRIADILAVPPVGARVRRRGKGDTSLAMSQSRHLHGSPCKDRRIVGEWEPQARRQAETPHVR